jgi:Zn-dependent peptidase ImmA (M78 family)
LGNPIGKVELADLRHLLKLDLHYYTSTDPSLADEVVHKLVVGAKQVVARPGLLLDVIKKFDLRALFVPDRKRILVDTTLPDLKKRWSETHEIAHSIIPWHAEYMLGDDRSTLSPSCHDRIECEANYGAGGLLYPRKPFLEIARSGPPSIALVKSIAVHFGNTITTALWRLVEHSEELVFATIGEHPHYAREGEPEIAYFIRSKRFLNEFSEISESSLFSAVAGYCSYKRNGPLGQGQIELLNDRRERYTFIAETFKNGHHALTLAHTAKQATTQVSAEDIGSIIRV